MRLIGVIFFFIYCLCIQTLNAQNNQLHKRSRYYTVPSNILRNFTSDNKFYNEYKKSLKDGFQLDRTFLEVDSLKDVTSIVQEAIDKYSIVVLPNRTMYINYKGIRLKSNQVLVFQEKSIIKTIPNDKQNFSAIVLDSIQNVKIFNANIQGDRYEHIGNSGQWGMGIRIISSKNVDLIFPKVKECWGDGIYIGSKNGISSRNIRIHDAFLDNNRRNGLSITAADNVLLDRPVISNTIGQSPNAGIDVEPNDNDVVIDNVVIKNPILFYNSIYGTVVSLTRFPGKNEKSVQVEIDSPIIFGGKYGIAVLGVYNNPNQYKINGSIEINNLKAYYVAKPFKEFSKQQFNLQISIDKFLIYHKSKAGKDYLNKKMMDYYVENITQLD